MSLKDILNVKKLQEIFNRDINKKYLEKDLYVELLDGRKAPVQCIEWGQTEATFLCDFSKLPVKENNRTYDYFDIFLDLVKTCSLNYYIGLQLPYYERVLATAYQIDREPFYKEVENSEDSKTEKIAAMADHLTLWIMRDHSKWDKRPKWVEIEENH